MNVDLPGFRKPQQGVSFFSEDRVRTATIRANLQQHSSGLDDATKSVSLCLPYLGGLPHVHTVRVGLRT